MKLTPDKYALMWVLDRLTTDNLTQREIDGTAAEVRKAIVGEPNRASSYSPNSWDESHKLIRKSEPFNGTPR